jgi:hypothetical protein
MDVHRTFGSTLRPRNVILRFETDFLDNQKSNTNESPTT